MLSELVGVSLFVAPIHNFTATKPKLSSFKFSSFQVFKQHGDDEQLLSFGISVSVYYWCNRFPLRVLLLVLLLCWCYCCWMICVIVTLSAYHIAPLPLLLSRALSLSCTRTRDLFAEISSALSSSFTVGTSQRSLLLLLLLLCCSSLYYSCVYGTLVECCLPRPTAVSCADRALSLLARATQLCGAAAVQARKRRPPTRKKVIRRS